MFERFTPFILKKLFDVSPKQIGSEQITMEIKSVPAETTKAPLGNIAAWPAAVKAYFEDLKSEMRRVTWPNQNQVKATTIVVIVSVFAFAAYFFVVDALINRGITQLFKVLAK
jgi:preprotein translocase subunit SecE